MASTHEVDVPGIGKFVFAQRTFKSQFLIEGKASRLLGGPVEDPMLRFGAGAYATLEVLTVSAPEGWDLASMDPFDTQSELLRLISVHEALREAEERFRRGSQGEHESQGAPSLKVA